MKIITTLYNQRLIDIAIQDLGDIERVYEICLLNNLPITYEVPAGMQLLVPDFDVTKRRIVNLFSNKSLAPASADDNNDFLNLPPGGIGFMQIENTFIVS